LYTQTGAQVSQRSLTAQQYGRFLIDVFEEWVRRDVGEVYVQMFDVALANWIGEPPGLCVHSETCGTALALEHTGDLYSCDHFVEPAYRLGVAHAAAPERAAELEALVRERRPRAELELVVTLGAVIGAHAGPGTLALFWFRVDG